MHRKTFFAFLGLFFSLSVIAQTGYEIRVTLKPFTKGYLFLAH